MHKSTQLIWTENLMRRTWYEIATQLWTRIFPIICTHISSQIAYWWTIDDGTCILRKSIHTDNRTGECFVFSHFSTIFLRKRRYNAQIVFSETMLESVVHVGNLRPPWITLKWLVCLLPYSRTSPCVGACFKTLSERCPHCCSSCSQSSLYF